MSKKMQVKLDDRKISFPHQILGPIEVHVKDVPYWGEKGFEVSGSILVENDKETVEIDAEAYKSGPEYRILSSTTPRYAHRRETDLEGVGETFAYVLLSAVEKIIRLDLQINHQYNYVENDGINYDLDIQSNLAIVP
jgi:hypothetical protein